MLRNYSLLLLVVFFMSCGQTEDIPTYKNPNLDPETRVLDLISRMTLKEKVLQLDMYHANHLITEGKLSTVKVDTMLRGYSTGSVHDFYPESAKESNELQKYIIENSRLGIPVLFIEEALHGYQGNKGTTFPVPIGMGSMWDVELMKKIGHAIASETRSVGVHMVLAPTLGIGREPRWGRVQETYGEDPYLAARNGVAIIKGMQGDDLTADDAIVSEPKHFGVHSIPEGGKNTAPVYIGEREARSNFLYVFEKAFKEAKALGAMAAYHEWDGVPAAADPWLLKKVLREEWGFKGMVISDLGAIVRQTGTHFTAKTPKEAITNSISAGLDMQFYDYTHKEYQESILEAVNDESLSMEDIDRAVSSILYVKFRLGLFENPYVDTSLKAKRYHSPKHQSIALEAAEKSVVLLQNTNNVLPLGNDIKNIAVIGELADKTLLGGYSPKNVDGVSIIEAFKETAYSVDFIDVSVPDSKSLQQIDSKFFTTKTNKEGLLAEYFNTIDFSGEPDVTRIEPTIANYWHNLSPAPGISSDNFSIRWTGYLTPQITGVYEFELIGDDFLRFFLDNKLLINNWKEDTKAKGSTYKIRLEKGKKYPLKVEYVELDDIASASLLWKVTPETGQKKIIYQEAVQAARKADLAILVLGEKVENGEGKDKTNLELSVFSEKLLDDVAKTNTPLVLVLQNGRPLVLSAVTDKVDAILETWYAGEFSGKATVDIITGKVNPSGKLPISFPRSVGQLPIYYNQKKSSSGGYVDASNKPLFAFGHGLSYSTFEYSDLTINKPEISKVEKQIITVNVKNTSDVAGTEIVQLYIRDSFSSVGTPKKQLRGFKRVALKPGEEKEVSFTLLPDDLSLWNRDMLRVVEAGEFQVMVGAASNAIKLKSVFNVK